MASYRDTVNDDYGRPIPGVLVYVFDKLGALATLDNGQANPITTDVLGAFAFSVVDGVYALEFRFAGVTRRQDNVIIGTPADFVGPTGPADNTYTSYAAMQASDPTRRSARLVGDTDNPPHPDGPYSNPTQTIGGWIAQPSDGITYDRAVTGSRKRPAKSKLDDIISVLDFIPVELHAAIQARTYTGDLSAYVNAAIRYVDNLANVSFGGGATLYFPAGDYPAQIDASNSNPGSFFTNIRLLGDGRHSTRITPPVTAAILLNCAGRNQLTVEDIEFWSAAYESQVGIYLCRTSASSNCNGNKFIGVRVAGNFSVSSVASFSAESSRWTDAVFENTNGASLHRLFFTGNNPSKLPVSLPSGMTPVIGPNTDNTMVGCIFYDPYDGARPIAFSGQGGWTMTGCSVIGGEKNNVRLVTYQDVIDGYFGGPVSWVSCHMELFGSGNAIHWLEAPANGPSYFLGINVWGGNYVISSGLPVLDYDRLSSNKQPILQSCSWKSPVTPVGADNNPIFVYAIQASHIHYRPNPNTGTVVVIGFAENCTFDVGMLRVTNFASTSVYTIGLNNSPGVGTFARGTHVRNMSPSVGQPIGWVCTQSGTADTSPNVTASSVAGSNKITVSSTTGLYEGARINIANGNNGPFVIQAFFGTDVYLDRPVTNAVSAQALTFYPAVFTPLANL